MCNNINVINEAEKDLIVTVNNVDGNIQITVKTKTERIDLLSLKSGEVFEIAGIEYIVLEQMDGNRTAVIRKNLLKNNMKFDSDNNNWKTSSIREFLNGKYLEEIEKVFGRDTIVEHIIDLLSLDGLDDYGTSSDKISMLTIDQYRRYIKVLGANLDNLWWLITPDSTPSGTGSSCVQFVDSCGYVYYCDCVCLSLGVRPFFILQS